MAWGCTPVCVCVCVGGGGGRRDCVNSPADLGGW